MSKVFNDPCSSAIILTGSPSAGCNKIQGRWILAATILASSMAFIDGTVVNVALPFLQTNLNATAADVQWVVESYSLFLAALLLVGGSLGDRYGRRRIFVIGVALFAMASIVCGLASNITQLIFARAVQGIGGALLIPGSLAIISASFLPDERGAAIGTWSGFSAITTAIGPVIGGWLVEHVSWRAVFFLNVPLAAAVIVISLWHVPESRVEETGRLDWWGAVLATAGLGFIVYGLIESAGAGFGRPLIILTLAGGTVAFLLFIVNEALAKNPMVPLDLFRIRDFAGANLLTLLLYTALGGTLFFFTLNLIQVQEYSATAAGAALLPLIFAMSLLSRWSGGLVRRYGARLPLIAGPLIAAAGFTLFAVPAISQNYWTSFFPAVLVLGLGMAITVAPLTTTVMGSVNEDQVGTASGINNAVSRTAGLLAIAIYGVVMLQIFGRALATKLDELKVGDDLRTTIYDQRIKLAGLALPSHLDPQVMSKVKEAVALSFVSGFRIIMFTSAVLAFAGALSAWLIIGVSRSTKAGKHAN